MSNAVAEKPRKAASSKVSLQTLHREMMGLRERVEDLEDLRELNQAIERNGNKPTVPWAEAKKRLGLK